MKRTIVKGDEKLLKKRVEAIKLKKYSAINNGYKFRVLMEEIQEVI